MTTKTTDKIWNFIKEKWLWILGGIVSVLIFLKLVKPVAKVDTESEKDKIDEVDSTSTEEEIEDVKTAEGHTQEVKDISDQNVKLQAQLQNAQIDAQVSAAVSADISQEPEKLASDIATQFGGTYVKTDASQDNETPASDVRRVVNWGDIHKR